MKLEDRNIEDIDITDEYEMVPLEPMMYGHEQMNTMPNMGINQNRGMSMGYIQNVDPNIGMNPFMGRNQNMGVNQEGRLNPWMGMSQFNESMFTNNFSPMDMMYGDVSNGDYDDENYGFRELDKYQERMPVNPQYNKPKPKPNPQYNDVESIARRIERYNPVIFRRLTKCGIPYVEAKEMVRRIIRLTLMYRDE